MGLGSCNKFYEAVNLATNKKCLLQNIVEQSVMQGQT